MKESVIIFIKFCIVGALCTAIDAGVFYSVKDATGYRMAMILGFVLSLTVNYLLNIYWSFHSKPSVSNAFGIIAAHCFNIFVVRMSLMYLFVDTIGLTDSIGYIPTLIISMVTNFFIIRFVANRF